MSLELSATYCAWLAGLVPTVIVNTRRSSRSYISALLTRACGNGGATGEARGEARPRGGAKLRGGDGVLALLAVMAESMYSSSLSSPMHSTKSIGASACALRSTPSATAPLLTPARRTSTTPLTAECETITPELRSFCWSACSSCRA